jgi:hypothetical protein
VRSGQVRGEEINQTVKTLADRFLVSPVILVVFARLIHDG